MPSPPEPLVEVYYDFTVPACFAAHERARRTWRDLPARFAWVPVEAEPTIPFPGRPRRAEEMQLSPELSEVFAELLLPFKPSKLVANSSLALRAVLWAAQQGSEAQADDVRDGVFRRLYERGLENHLYLADVLAGIVERSGFDPIQFLDEMREGACTAELKAKEARAGVLVGKDLPMATVDARVVASGVPGPDFGHRLQAALSGPRRT